MEGIIHQKKIRYSLIALFSIIGAWALFENSVTQTAIAVWHREGSSHGLFIPFIAFYFIWQKRERLREIDIAIDWLGIPLILCAVVFGLAGRQFFQIGFFGFILFVVGLACFLLGRKLLREISFPLFFLLTMIPIPTDTYVSMAEMTRDITLEGAVFVITKWGIPFFRNGIMIELPNVMLKVNLGCSGIRYLVSYVIFGLAYAYLFRKNNLSRVLVVLAVFPISIGASIFRLSLIFLLTYYIGPQMAEYWPHVIISWVNFFLVMMLTLFLDQWYLRRRSMIRK